MAYSLPGALATDRPPFRGRPYEGQRGCYLRIPVVEADAAQVRAVLVAPSSTMVWRGYPKAGVVLENHFRAVNESLIIRQIAALPVLGWQYKTEPSNVRHLGRFAGDFRRALGLGPDSLSLGLQDTEGGLFVGLKELARQHTALAAPARALQADNEALRTRLARLEQQVQQLASAPAATFIASLLASGSLSFASASPGPPKPAGRSPSCAATVKPCACS